MTTAVRPEIKDATGKSALWGYNVLSVPDEFGGQHLTLGSLGSGSPAVTLFFLDGRVTTVATSYGDKVKWDSIGEFTSKVIAAMKLPDLPAWRYGLTNADALLSCDGFAVKTTIFQHTSITIEDSRTDGIIEGRKREVEQKKKDAFKP